jgi:hypothetical protein
MAWGKLYHRSTGDQIGCTVATKNLFKSADTKRNRNGHRIETAFTKLGRNAMEYMLVLYPDESGGKLSMAEQEQRYAAYMAYTEALKKSGRIAIWPNVSVH